MIVKILVPGRYLGKDLKAVDCQAGQVFETAGWYGQEMILHGQAAAYVPEPVSTETAPEPEQKPEPKPAEKRKPARRSNPFLGG